MLSNDKRRAYYDKHGTIEGEEDGADMDSFFEDLFKGGFGADIVIDDFDEFMNVLEGGNDKAFRKLFRDLGRGYRQKP